MQVEKLIEKRNELEQRKSRLLGKMEVAISALSEIDEKFLAMGVDPSNVDEEIQRLSQERESKIQTLKNNLNLAEQALCLVEESVKSV
jgi:hypothetical protein